MPLVLGIRSPAAHPDGSFEIAAASGDGVRIRVKVTSEAINTMAPPPGTYLERLRANLPRFGEIASRKYDADKIEEDGSILIKPDDVLDFSYLVHVSWELTARTFFDQLSKREQALVERSVLQLADNWEQLAPKHLHTLRGLSGKDGQPLLALSAGRDLRVIHYREDQHIVVVDVLRHSQIERLRSTPGFRP